VGKSTGPSEEEFSRRWQELSEQLSAEVSPPQSDDAIGQTAPPPPLPAAPTSPDDDGEAARHDTALAPDDDPWEAAPIVPFGPRDWDAPEVEDHFVPPTPPPVLSGEPLLVLAWIAVAVGLIGLAVVVVFHIATSVMVPRGLALLAAVGVGVLLWRMPHRREDPDDSGAQL